MLELDLLTDVPRLSDLQHEWRQLECSVAGATPFQTPEWLLTWWQHFGSGELRTFVFRNSGHLVGILPAFLHNWNERSQLTLLGTGISDFLDPLLASPISREISCGLLRHLSESKEWDVCDWQDLTDAAPLIQCSPDFGLAVEAVTDTPCAAITMNQPFADFWKLRSSGLRRNVRRYRQKAEEVAPLETEVTSSAGREYLDALIRLHSARWREQGEPGMIAANRSAAFLRDVVERLEARGIVRFFALRFQGTIAAVILGFEYRQTIYAYLSAFDPAYAAFGFGRLLLFEALQYAFANGCKSWNFLRGEEPYKFEWGAEQIAKTHLVIRPAA